MKVVDAFDFVRTRVSVDEDEEGLEWSDDAL